MQDIREIELRNSGSANNKICFEVQATALRPRILTQKDFYYVHTGPSTRGPLLKNYNTILRVHYSSLKHNHLYTKPKQRKDYNLGDPMNTNNTW